MTRKRFTEREVIETLAWQGVIVRCFRCNAPFYTPSPDGGMFNLSDKIEREHLHEVGLDGPDIPANCRYSCGPCHLVVTNGTKATSAGSSKQRIAKIKRLANPRPSKRPMVNSGKKMASRPFPKASANWGMK